MNPFDLINPLKHIPQDQYISWWQIAFATIFSGFWARVISVALLITAVWLVTKKQAILAAICIILTFTIAYGFSILRFMGFMK